LWGFVNFFLAFLNLEFTNGDLITVVFGVLLQFLRPLEISIRKSPNDNYQKYHHEANCTH